MWMSNKNIIKIGIVLCVLAFKIPMDTLALIRHLDSLANDF